MRALTFYYEWIPFFISIGLGYDPDEHALCFMLPCVYFELRFKKHRRKK